MMPVRAGAWCVVASVLSCATGIEPTLEQSAIEVSGGSGGAETAGGSAADAGAQTSAGSDAVAGGMAGKGGKSSGGGGGLSGSAGAGGSLSAAGAGGSVGAGGNAGVGGNAGTGGMPATPGPTRLNISATKNATARAEPSVGGTGYDDACPQGQVLIGFNGTIGADQTYLRSVSGVCATLTMQAKAPYAITTTQAGSLPVRPGAQATAQAGLCPANQVVVGFQGRSGGFVDGLSFKCAPLSVGAGPNYPLVIGTATDTSLIGGTGGSPFAAMSCANGQVAVSQRPFGAGAIDSFGLACSPVTVVVE